jgi:hypothetical protein
MKRFVYRNRLLAVTAAVLAALAAALLAGACPSETESRTVPVEVTLSRIEITSAPNKVLYEIGERLNLDGLAVTAVYHNNTRKEIPAGSVTTGGFNSEKSGVVTVTVSYTDPGGTGTATFDVLVGLTPVSIVILKPPLSTGVRTGFQPDLNGLEVEVRFAELPDPVKLSHGSVSVIGFDPNTEGEQTVTVGVGTARAEFKLYVARTVKTNLKGRRIIHTSWSEQGVDPRVHIGYELENGVPFFDHFVQLYGLRLAERDCANEANPQTCNKTGVHWCVMDMIYNRMYRDYEITVKPVRERGIKYLIGIVPDGIAVGNLYRWPMSVDAEYAWEALTGDAKYPYDVDTVDKLLDELQEIYNATPFDGVAYDEEYASGIRSGTVRGVVKTLSGYPDTSVYPGMSTGAAWVRGGENLIRFGHEVNEKIAGPGRKLIQESYEIRYGGTMPRTYTYTDERTGKTVTLNRDDIIDYSYEAFYGNWQKDSGNPDYPRSRYGPVSIDMGFDSGSPKPSPGRSAGSGIIPRMEDHLRGNYGVVMYYHLTSKKYIQLSRPSNYYGSDGAPAETYLSEIGRILHGMEVRYIGDDWNY